MPMRSCCFMAEAQTRHAWGTTLQRLAARGYFALSADLRGHGDSDWASDKNYSLDAFKEDVLIILRQIGRPSAVVGASLGGATALLAASKDSEQLIAALVLVDITPRMSKEGAERIRDFMLARTDGFASLEEAADTVAIYLPHRPRPKDTSGLQKNLRVRADGRLHWHWDPAFMQYAEAEDAEARTTGMEDAARQVGVPTLLIRGAKK